MSATPSTTTDYAAPAISLSGNASASPSLGTNGQSAVSAAQIDGRRADQLLDRAFLLYSQGEVNNAILACRQAISLAPQSPPAHSLLGLLMERNGQVAEAIEAYEKVVAFAPDSALERDSLQRLRSAAPQSRQAAGFDFNDAELFDDIAANAAPPEPLKRVETPDELIAVPPVADVIAPVVAASVIAAPVMAAPVMAAPVMAAPVMAAPVMAAPVMAAPVVAPSGPRVVPATPNRNPAPRSGAFGLGKVSAAGAPTAGVSSNAASPFDSALDLDEPKTGAAAFWQGLLSRPSYFYRGVPLLATALLSLLFLSWAQHRASVRFQENPPPSVERVSAFPDDGAVQPNYAPPAGLPSGVASQNANTGSLTGPQGDNPGTPFGIGNAPAPPPSTAPSGNTPNAAPNLNGNNSASNRRPRNSSNGSPRPVPEYNVPPFPVPMMPAPASPGNSSPATASGSLAPASPNGGAPVFPDIPFRRPVIAPRNDSASPVRGLPVEEGDAPPPSAGQGAIRILPDNPSPASAPSRALARAREAEERARRAARAGNATGALNQLNQALGSGSGGTGWNYQQRGLIQLQNGDYDRAIDSFRTAIQGYSEQISRGQNAAEARSGIQTCRSGIRMAQTQKRQ